MKRLFLFLFLFSITFASVSQQKKRDRVKRKYRNVEQVNQNLPQVYLRGLVRDEAKIPVAGASVEVEGLAKIVHSNESGQFMLAELPTGRMRIRIACLGYQTRTVDYVMQPGFNDHYFTLEKGVVSLPTEIAVSQNREQQISDIPASVSVFDRHLFDSQYINYLSGIGVFEPSLRFEKNGAGSSTIFIQGANGNSGYPGMTPGVAVYTDHVPVSQPGGFADKFYDMERVEVMKGPQNVLFGANALNGAVHSVTKKPGNGFGGHVSAGYGNFGKKEVEAVVNLPLLEEKLFARAAGVYHHRNGFVENSAGGSLNGSNLLGVRFALRFLPAWNHKIDLQFNYQSAKEPGIAFINKGFSNENGGTEMFNYIASLNRGEELGSEAERMDATLTYRFFRNEHNYWTSVTSFRKNNSKNQWDADGSYYPALEMDNETVTGLFFQEIRYNFSLLSRSNGSLGLNFLQEKTDFQQDVFSSDQLISQLATFSDSFFPEPHQFPVFPRPLEPVSAENLQLEANHSEQFFQQSKKQTAQAFLQYTYQLHRQLAFTLGVNAAYYRLQLNHESAFLDGEPSSLGEFFGAAPNLVFRPTARQEQKENNFSLTGQAGFSYRWNENFNLYLNAARGRRPQVLQFRWEGRPLIAGAETVYSGEAGWKTIVKKRIFWDVSGYFRRHFDVHTLDWAGEPGAAWVAADGKATSYGAETSLKAAVIPGLDVFGKYAWMQSSFDSTGVDGTDFRYAGNSFSHAPQHSFSAGFSGKLHVARNFRIFVTPWFAWQSHFWFTAANTPALGQPAYGTMNVSLGVEFDDPNLALQFHGTNLFEEKYISSAGHWGNRFGIPTFMPGDPKILDLRILWKF